MDDMKFLMISGALAGFLVAVIVGVMAHNEWPVILRNASLVALACGVGMRWWTRVWVRNLHRALHERSVVARSSKDAKAASPLRS